jgi:hypothetical protein
MTVEKDNQRLGMDRTITRRDFLNGVAIGAGGIASPGWLSALGPDEFASELIRSASIKLTTRSFTVRSSWELVFSSIAKLSAKTGLCPA